MLRRKRRYRGIACLLPFVRRFRPEPTLAVEKQWPRGRLTDVPLSALAMTRLNAPISSSEPMEWDRSFAVLSRRTPLLHTQAMLRGAAFFLRQICPLMTPSFYLIVSLS